MNYRKTHGRKNWKYQQNERHENRDLRLAKDGRYPTNFWVDWTWDANGIHMIPTGNYIKRPKRSTMRVYYKKQTSRTLRQCKDEIVNYSGYRKYYDLWWKID